MKLDEKNIKRLEAYFDGSLEAEDGAELERQLAEDAGLRKEVQRYQAVWAALRTAGEARLLEQLRSFEKELPPVQSHGKVVQAWVKWAVAAALVLGISAVIWHLTHREPAYVALANESFEPFPTFGIINKSGDGETRAQEAARAYSSRDYQAAYPLFLQAFGDQRDSMLLFYAGVSAVGAVQPLNAKPILEKLSGSKTAPQDAAKWYLALALLQLENKEAALPLLTQLKDTGGVYGQKAEELMKKLSGG